jgi:hypothetical protein
MFYSSSTGGLGQQTLETGISLQRGPVENRGGARSPGTLTDSWRALETEHLSLRALCEGILKGRILYWKAMVTDISLHRGPVG